MSRFASDVSIAANLRMLCSLYPSVSEVSRKLGINRQQLNKYLAGTSHPSLHNLRRITDFFGVDEFEIMLPAEAFQASVLPRRVEAEKKQAAASPSLMPAHSEEMQQKLANYCGYYHVYFCTPVWSNHVVRALTKVFQRDGRTLTKSIELLRDRRAGTTQGPVQKFSGQMSLVVDRVCVLEYETAIDELLTMTVLYPSHRRSLRFLTGLLTGVASGGSRQPFASRIVYEFLGRKIDGRAAIRACGLFLPDDPSISEDIRRRVVNEIAPNEAVLLPRSY